MKTEIKQGTRWKARREAIRRRRRRRRRRKDKKAMAVKTKEKSGN